VSAPDPCTRLDDSDAVHRYVAGTLPPAEVESFEIHLLGCDACQRAVREGMVLGQALRRPGASRRRWPVALGVPLAAAAAAAVWLVLPKAGALERLGRFDEAPTFTPIPIRAATDSGTVLIHRGMQAYLAGDFPTAARDLAAGVRLDPGPGAYFYLGIAQLRTDAPESALTSLAGGLDPEGNPYAAEAHFYLAKAWLRLARADSALAHLQAIPGAAGAIHSAAVALADSVRRARR
jgi:tetratricopeptide (TPR) repeat protein